MYRITKSSFLHYNLFDPKQIDYFALPFASKDKIKNELGWETFTEIDNFLSLNIFHIISEYSWNCTSLNMRRWKCLGKVFKGSDVNNYQKYSGSSLYLPYLKTNFNMSKVQSRHMYFKSKYGWINLIYKNNIFKIHRYLLFFCWINVFSLFKVVEMFTECEYSVWVLFYSCVLSSWMLKWILHLKR